MLEQLDRNIMRAPGRMLLANIPPSPRGEVVPVQAGATVCAPFDHVKHLLSHTPLKRPNRTAPLRLDEEAEDRADIAAALEAMKEEGSISLEDLEKELGE